MIIPEWNDDKRKAGYKELKKSTENLAQVQGKLVIDFDDVKAIKIMDHNIRIHPTAKLFIGKPKPKMVVVWVDPETKKLCKAQFDIEPIAHPESGKIVISDLKTTKDTSEHGFRNEILKFHYDFSAAMYINGASIALKESINDFVFLFIAPEKDFPHRVHVHELAPSFLDKGNGEFQESLRKEKACQEAKFYEPWVSGGVIVQDWNKKQE